MIISRSKKYDQAVDVLRTLAILAVLIIHTTTRTLEITGFHFPAYWWTLFLNQTARYAVALFFLMSGFLLELNHHPEENYLEFLVKRLQRIALPYVFWSFIYYFFVYTQNRAGIGPMLLYGSAAHQLYFIPSILLLYLIFPLLHRLYKFLTHPLVLAILGLMEVFLLYRDYYVQSLPFAFPLSIALMAYFVFILGMVGAHKRPALLTFMKKYRYPATLVTIGLGLLVFFQGMIRYNHTGNYQSFYSQWRPSVLAYTIMLAITLYYWLKRVKLPVKPVALLARLSFFVFFFHLIPLEWLWRHAGTYLFAVFGKQLPQAFWYDPLFFLVTSTAAFGVAYLVHKIPFLSKLTG